MEATTWQRMDEALRTELEALLEAPTDAFLSDYKDALGWWLLVLLACIGGASVAIWNIADDMIPLSHYAAMFGADPISTLLMRPHILGLLAAVIIGPWVVITCARNYGRRGFAALDTAIVVLRGPKLKVLRYRDIASTERRVIGARGQRFTVLTLKLKDGKTEELSVTGRWAEEVITRLERAT